jgi:Uma2 family endonuclease
VEEFGRASALGLFRPEERLELIQGEIYEKMPPNPPHASLTDSIAETLRRIAATSKPVA